MGNIALTTASAIGGVELVEHIPDTGNPKMDIIKLALQAVIAIVGVIRLIRDKKTKDVQQQQ